MAALESLFAELRAVCADLPDRRKGPCNDGQYTMTDIGLSAFSVFFMGSPSFLGHQRALEEGHGRSNCQTLFGMTAIPTDPYIRLMLDGAPPAAFDPLFFKTIATEGVLDPFQRLNGRVLIALDGTEHFCSRKIHCPRCSTRKRSDGGTEYCHAFLGASIVAPGHQQVLPLPPEFIAPQDGAEKQDCERNAAKPRPSQGQATGSCGTDPQWPTASRFFSATICSPVSPSPPRSSRQAEISSSHASRPRIRPSPNISTAPNAKNTAPPPSPAASARQRSTAGFPPCRCATPRTP